MRIFRRSAMNIYCRKALAAVLVGSISSGHAEDIQFNTDILDVKDRENYDLSQFSRKGYILPGMYSLAIQLNEQKLPEQNIDFIVPDDDPNGSEACLTAEIIKQLGLKKSALRDLTWWHDGQCLSTASLPGMEIRTDLSSVTLYVSVPQAYLEYSHPDWDPPVRWENGIPGALFDYNLNAQTLKQKKSDAGTSHYLSANGTAGVNVGAWRLRGDWQARHEKTPHQTGTEQPWQWSRIYAYRTLGEMGAKLTLGENYLNSAMFDSFRYTGVNVATDDAMLPPNLRGYAPEVTGVARTNARVVISQQGRLIKEVQVAAGPFRIQDLSSAVNGTLDVLIEEQDGNEQRLQVDTATIPYLTRPGLVRYKVTLGQPSDWEHRLNGSLFASGEFAWGISNGWSLYGGLLGDSQYQALSLGVGRDLMMFGALSGDITESRMRLADQALLRGRSYRLSYSKRFDSTNSQITFAGYRFSEQDFANMNDYLAARLQGEWSRYGRNKEMYTLSFNQYIELLGLTANLNYNHQTYWDRPESDSYTLTMSRGFDFWRFRNVNLSLTGFRNKYRNDSDEGMYLSLSMPLGERSRLSYNGAYTRREQRNNVSYYDRPGDNQSYQLGIGKSQQRNEFNGFYGYNGSIADVTATGSWVEGQYESYGMSVQGGATVTPQGAALHRISSPGGTRMLIDTHGVSGIPIADSGRSTYTNYFGKAVVGSMNDYSRNSVSIDVAKLPDRAEALRSVSQATLTEGAIGYRSFEVVSGDKAMAFIRLADGSVPPFGATVLNGKQQETGIVSDDGHVYLSGIQPGGVMSVRWAGAVQCNITLPAVLAEGMNSELFLPCERRPETNE